MTNETEGDLTIHTTDGDGAVVVTVAGEIDSSNCGVLQDLLTDMARDRSSGGVDVDLAAVTFIDSSGLRALIVGQRAMAEAGGSLRVTAASESVRRLFEITGLVERLGLPA